MYIRHALPQHPVALYIKIHFSLRYRPLCNTRQVLKIFKLNLLKLEVCCTMGGSGG
jgi:hypothetical protein